MNKQSIKCAASPAMMSTLALALMGCGGGEGPSPSASSGSGGAVVSTPIASPSPSPAASPSSASAPTPTPTPTQTGTATGAASVQDGLLRVMLEDHNAARREVGVPALVLDNDLSRQALEYAQELARTRTFEHSPNSARPDQGENLWAGTAGRFTHQQQAGAWIDEKRFYIHDRFPYVSNTGSWQDVGHYTQIIWRNTTRLGCGIATGGGRDYVVCRYSPAGNFIGQFAY